MNSKAWNGDEAAALRVLVVDDHWTNREVACVLLSAAGCETATAGDGAEALLAVRDGGFDAVLMDVRMPVMNGLEVTRAIRALPGLPGLTPIVAVTADAMPDEVSRCLEAGMNAHLPKPISGASLMEVLARALAGGIGRPQPVRTARSTGS